MTFTTIPLTGERTLVKGQDQFGVEGEVVLDSAEWNHVQAQVAVLEAHETFDSAVEAFFAPLMEAQAQLEASHSRPEIDPVSYIVLDEGEEGTPARQRHVHKLGRDAIVLRILEDGDHDRLVWVAGQLEVLATIPGTDTPTAQATAAEVLGATAVDEG
jgi:hypothetical protein